MTDAIATLQQALADRYTIERELGRGGHAVVYLAHDIKHDRQVALKVLPPELGRAVRGERFLREIQITARLTHPHILSIYDSGRAGDFLYYVMPYIETESLRDRLNREKQLPLDDALAMTRDVASALAHAHAQGFVHRDIKPENILISHGEALLADFGIAGALAAAGEEGTGTPLYMPPEQSTAGAAADVRSDQYALACIVYEMLAGHPPFTGATVQELIGRHALDPVPSLQAARATVPRAAARVITKALAKQPADRFASVMQFAAALDNAARSASRRRYALAVGGIAVTAAILIAIVGRDDDLGLPPDQASVAVLPFVNLSGDTASEYFSDGMTEELINALVKVAGLRVPARTSSFAFKGKTGDIAEIGRQLRVAAVMEGSVRRSGNALRITVQLINVADGYHRWSETYERELRDVFAVQEGIARAIVTELAPQLLAGRTGPLVQPPTANLAAYDFYLQGRYGWHQRDERGFRAAIAFFEAAIEQDSTFALAYSGLADTYVLSGEQRTLRMPVPEANARAKTAALRAVALGGGLAETHTSLARVLANVDGDYAEAEREFHEAIRLNSRYALGHSWYGLHLRRHHPGRDRDAVRESLIAEELDPLSAGIANNLGIALAAVRRDAEAIARYRKAAQLAPEWATPHGNLARLYLRQGRLQDATAEFEAEHALNPRRGVGELGHVYGLAGRRDDALRMLAELERRRATDPAPFGFAMIYAGLGDKDRAFAALDSAIDLIPQYRAQPDLALWNPLRSDPRFAKLLPRWKAKVQVAGSVDP